MALVGRVFGLDVLRRIRCAVASAITVKFVKVLIALFLVGALCICSIGGALYYKWSRTGPPIPPNYYEIDPAVHGLVLIVSLKNQSTPALGVQHLAIKSNFIVAPSSFSENSGTWYAKVGTREYNSLSPYATDPKLEGVWNVGTITAEELPDHKVLMIYVGKAGDALTAGSGKAIKKISQEVAAKLKATKP